MKKLYLIVITLCTLLLTVNTYSRHNKLIQQQKRVRQTTTAAVTDGGVKSGGGQGGSQQDTAKVSTSNTGKKRLPDSLPPIRKNKRGVIKH